MKIQYRRKRLKTEQKVKIATDYNAGISVEDIMKKYGIARSTVYAVLNTVANDAYYDDDRVTIH